jgi:hypothetical protein
MQRSVRPRTAVLSRGGCRRQAEAERAAFVAWQEAYGAYEIARDEASTAWTAWVEAIVP